MKDKCDNKEVEVATEHISHTDKIRNDNRLYLDSVLKSELPEMCNWFADLNRFGGNLIDATVIEVLNLEGPIRVRISLFTERHKYAIVVKKAHVTEAVEEGGYLGATVNKRASRAGEDWTRGSDLADGSYSEDTWKKILADIVAYEMVRLGK